MGMLKGIKVILITNKQIGVDSFHKPIYEDVEIEVENVLVAPSTTDDITSAQDLYGKKAVYTLGIPKTDTHNWENCKVKFFGEIWRSFGYPIQGIDALIPGEWNKKVMVERYG